MCGNTMVGNATDSAFTDIAPECAPVVIPTPAPTPDPVVITSPPVVVTSPPVVTTVEVPVPAAYCVVPKLKGLTTSSATAALTKAGCAAGKVSKKKAGRVQEGQGAHPGRAGRDVGQDRAPRSPSPSGSSRSGECPGI